MWCACAHEVEHKGHLILMGLQIFYHQLSSAVRLPFVPYPIYETAWIKICCKCKCEVDDWVLLGVLVFCRTWTSGVTEVGMAVEAEPPKIGGRCDDPAVALIIPTKEEEKEDPP